MTFKEEFPELSALPDRFADFKAAGLSVFQEQIVQAAFLKLFRMIEDDVQKHCLDKQRVRKIVDAFAKECDVDGRGILFEFTDTDLRDLKRELGFYND